MLRVDDLCRFYACYIIASWQVPRARTHRRVDTVFVTFGMHWTGLSSPFTHTCIHIPPSTNPQEEEGGWEGGRGLLEGAREGRVSGRDWWVGGFLAVAWGEGGEYLFSGDSANLA